MKRGWCGLFFLLGLAHCGESARRALTAGEIGCPPDAVTVKDVTTEGFSQQTETWAAECRGRRFICTKRTTHTLGDDKNPLLVKTGDTDVACREEIGTEAALAKGDGASKVEAAPTDAPAPKGGAGFELGATRAATQEACEDAEKSWESVGTRGVCSGGATELGFEASVRVDFCRERACKITIVYAPEAKWTAAVDELKTKLAQKYGEPAHSDAKIPSNCRSDQEIVGCFEKGLRLHFGWAWKSGDRVHLRAGKSEQAEEPAAIRIEYVRPAGPVGADASAL